MDLVMFKRNVGATSSFQCLGLPDEPVTMRWMVVHQIFQFWVRRSLDTKANNALYYFTHSVQISAWGKIHESCLFISYSKITNHYETIIA